MGGEICQLSGYHGNTILLRHICIHAAHGLPQLQSLSLVNKLSVTALARGLDAGEAQDIEASEGVALGLKHHDSVPKSRHPKPPSGVSG